MKAIKSPTSNQESAHSFIGVVSHFARLFLFAMVFLLLGLSLFVTVKFDTKCGLIVGDVPHFVLTDFNTLFVNLIIPIIFAVLFLILVQVFKRFDFKFKNLCLVLFSVSMLFQIVLLVGEIGNYPYPYADSLRLDALAKALINLNYKLFSSSALGGTSEVPYLYYYPFQSGSIFTLALVYRIFGLGNQFAFQIINAIFNSVSAVALLFIGKVLWGDRDTIFITFCLLLFCLPLYLSASMVYGNSTGLSFALLSIAFAVDAMVREKHDVSFFIRVSLSAFFMAISLIIKSTFVLLLIGLILGWIIYSIYKRCPGVLIVVLALSFFANSGSSFVVGSLENIVGVDFGNGMPKTSWIAMGLRTSEVNGAPGWWDLYPSDLYQKYNGDYSKQNTEAMDSIKGSLSSFLSHPNKLVKFFAKKLSSEWCDPSFQTLYYSSLNTTGSTLIKSKYVGRLIENGSNTNRIATEVMKGHELLVFVGTLTSCLCLYRNRRLTKINNIVFMTLSLLVLCGFGCYMLWEAKSIYMLPFYLLLIPLGAFGINYIISNGSKLMTHFIDFCKKN